MDSEVLVLMSSGLGVGMTLGLVCDLIGSLYGLFWETVKPL